MSRHATSVSGTPFSESSVVTICCVVCCWTTR
ncbi:hypothetical protein SCE1572_47210 [Sorangium cellulosum So0157-2]|uniref:Uncharacterized protein n=1 Tax=Sorangium cellulosum So0157-2 TaxID=1254432 RepID=S4Y7M7_SORCE|nr:hypothetical protein SCE1572_47210 [Sorangium cellulosum So0157-2]